MKDKQEEIIKMNLRIKKKKVKSFIGISTKVTYDTPLEDSSYVHDLRTGKIMVRNATKAIRYWDKSNQRLLDYYIIPWNFKRGYRLICRLKAHDRLKNLK